MAGDAKLGRGLGYGGKLAIHPAQLAVIERAFAPSATMIAEARRIVEAAEGTEGGVTEVDDRVVDEPILQHARQLLEDTECRDAQAKS